MRGKVAYRVLRGPYEQLPGAWVEFPMKALEKAQSAPRGPAGDVYVCSPLEHKNDEARMLTVRYTPVM